MRELDGERELVNGVAIVRENPSKFSIKSSTDVMLIREMSRGHFDNQWANFRAPARLRNKESYLFF